jgi:16S rRNA (guanine527-N7)-methyltransferase
VTELEPELRRAGVAEPIAERLGLYGELVLAENRRFNLTGAKGAAELLGHLLDSLSVVPFVAAPYVDVGSGAGLPAIPVLIATGASTTLIESNRKKAHFLESALQRLGLTAAVVSERAEAAGRREDLRDRFASGTARAVASAPAAAELLLPFIAPGGVAILQQGRLDATERQALEDAVLVLGGRLEAERIVEGKRRLVLVRKEAPTPVRFPRRTGIPQKRPLCST